MSLARSARAPSPLIQFSYQACAVRPKLRSVSLMYTRTDSSWIQDVTTRKCSRTRKGLPQLLRRIQTSEHQNAGTSGYPAEASSRSGGIECFNNSGARCTSRQVAQKGRWRAVPAVHSTEIPGCHREPERRDLWLHWGPGSPTGRPHRCSAGCRCHSHVPNRQEERKQGRLVHSQILSRCLAGACNCQNLPAVHACGCLQGEVR